MKRKLSPPASIYTPGIVFCESIVPVAVAVEGWLVAGHLGKIGQELAFFWSGAMSWSSSCRYRCRTHEMHVCVAVFGNFWGGERDHFLSLFFFLPLRRGCCVRGPLNFMAAD